MKPHGPLPDGEPGFAPSLVPGTTTGPGGPPGFPTLKSLHVLPELKHVGVNILGQPSKRESLILKLLVGTFAYCPASMQ